MLPTWCSVCGVCSRWQGGAVVATAFVAGVAVVVGDAGVVSSLLSSVAIVVVAVCHCRVIVLACGRLVVGVVVGVGAQQDEHGGDQRSRLHVAPGESVLGEDATQRGLSDVGRTVRETTEQSSRVLFLQS